MLVPVGLVIVFVVLSLAIAAALNGSDTTSSAAAANVGKLAPYWVVRSGETYASIARRTGLTVEQLERFNPYTDPSSLDPGQRVKLRAHVPSAPAKPRGPRFWTVRRGETFASIARKTGHAVSWLQGLNKRLNPIALQPGQRVRLRH